MERKPRLAQLIKALNSQIPELQLRRTALKFSNRINPSKLITPRTIRLIKVGKEIIQEQLTSVQL